MKTCKQFFSRSLMLFTSLEVRSCSDELAKLFGFILLSYPYGDIKCQRIFRVTNSIVDAADWVNSTDGDNRRVAVSCAEL